MLVQLEIVSLKWTWISYEGRVGGGHWRAVTPLGTYEVSHARRVDSEPVQVEFEDKRIAELPSMVVGKNCEAMQNAKRLAGKDYKQRVLKLVEPWVKKT